MDIKQCYEAMGADYGDVLSRFRTDDRIRRFLKLFPKDESFSLLESSLESKDLQTAFRAAHTLKGVAMNLSLTAMAQASSELTEALRGGEVKGDVDALFAVVKENYTQAISAISQLD